MICSLHLLESICCSVNDSVLEWHSSGVTRTRVIRVKISEIDQGKENLVRLSEELELSSGVRVNLVKMTEKLMGKIQEKLDLV